MHRASRAALLMGLVLAAGCGGGGGDGPAEVHWDRDACAHCNMGISDRRHAAQIRLPGKRRAALFDDPGCALLWLHDQPGDAVDTASIWVREPEADGWRDARTSRFTPGATTPMDYGFAVVAGEPEGSLTLEQVWTQLEQADRERRASRR
jgi:hypothetical protein